ncbi:N,N'-diacetyllegionaminic acid synthase [Roseimaritima multifibrata]|uniref:N,N'-diacetyllegionaminic acid synthase n=1 Tax=Roseimaritima multifibrata TaxID=1930274 RepID=A0A517MN95_9BACT|nr:N-acetylneuraminate synthase family protein [Roseimaritima multifibrata]QDS96355.1 N,N'-diacetyllegionaminic acid synthase [Roseimaritima multifibrata]
MNSFLEIDRPYVIAEIGGNHEGDMDFARKLLLDAAEAGADAVKFQAYSPDKIVNKLQDPERHQHFGKFTLSLEQYRELAEMCVEVEVDFMASVWDMGAFRFLDPLIAVHKIGSGDLTNYRLLKPMAETGKPICIATAMADMEEVLAAVAFVRDVNPAIVESGGLCVMHCVAMYGDPRDEYANLAAIDALAAALPPQVVVGYSDHTLGNVAVKVAVERGARVIETHFTDDNSRDFRDHHFAHTKEELNDFVVYLRRRQEMLGRAVKVPVFEVETSDRIAEFRRAVYLRRDCLAGTVVSEDLLTTLRPLRGISASEYFKVVGKVASRDLVAYEPLDWGDFK